MNAVPITQETYLPDVDSEDVALIHDFVAAREQTGLDAPAPRFFLSGAAAGERVEIPHEVYRVLRQVVEAMSQGLAVTVAPHSQTLTTQQAADLLGVSRPTVIKLLDEGRIPYERNGTHRRILLRDLLAYRERRRQEQYAALEATVDVADDGDYAETLERLREARRFVAARRRAEASASRD